MLGVTLYFEHHLANLLDSTSFQLIESLKFRPTKLSIFLISLVPVMKSSESRHTLVYSSSLSFCSFYKNINRFTPFASCLLFFEWPTKHSTIHMTGKASVYQQRAIQLVSTGSLPSLIHLFVFTTLQIAWVWLFINLFNDICRQRRLTSSCLPQISFNI